MPEQFSAAEQHIPPVERQKAAEQIFSSLIFEKILKDFRQALDNCGYEPEDIEQIEKGISSLSEEDRKAALSIPVEIRESYLQRLKDMSPEQVVQKLVENGRKYGFSIGYHVSPFAMEGNDIVGREPDHRDNDLPRAYYSTNYRDLYLKKRGNNLYVVRAETGPNSSHRQDNDGVWGRASTLAIISRFDLKDVRSEVSKRLKEYEQQKLKEKAADKSAAA